MTYFPLVFVLCIQVVFKSAGQGALSVEVTIQNKGVAPFYYDLYLKATASGVNSYSGFRNS